MNDSKHKKNDKERNVRRSSFAHLIAVLEVLLDDPEHQERAEQIVERRKREREKDSGLAE